VRPNLMLALILMFTVYAFFLVTITALVDHL
jgi:hypothetical protein